MILIVTWKLKGRQSKASNAMTDIKRLTVALQNREEDKSQKRIKEKAMVTTSALGNR